MIAQPFIAVYHHLRLRRLGWFMCGLICLATVRLPAAETIIKSEFRRRKASPEWTVPQLPANEQRNPDYLGPLSNQKAVLTLKALPPHEYLRLSFDLITIGDWTGSADDEGRPRPAADVPLLRIGLQDKPALLAASFSSSGNPLQSYPELDPRILAPAETGSRERRMELIPRDPFGGQSDFDATIYRRTLVIPHQAETVTWEFAGEHLGDVNLQHWGLDNVMVEALTATEVPAFTAAQLRALPGILREANHTAAADACYDLIARPTQAIELAQAQRAELLREDPVYLNRMRQARELVKKLDAPLFADREEAFRSLAELGPQTHATLGRELAIAGSPESKERIRTLLAMKPAGEAILYPPQALARMRWTKILELLDTPESRALAATLRWE